MIDKAKEELIGEHDKQVIAKIKRRLNSINDAKARVKRAGKAVEEAVKINDEEGTNETRRALEEANEMKAYADEDLEDLETKFDKFTEQNIKVVA